MKKCLSALLMILSAYLLTACKVNVFGSSYDVPWYIIGVPCILFLLACVLTAHGSIVRRTYQCPGCGKRFKPKWYEISSWIHLNDERVMRCPKCGRKGFCKRQDD